MEKFTKFAFRRTRRGRRGFVVIAIALSLVAIMGFVGLSVDLGRVFVVKNELQTFADAGALAAAKELNGLASGITRGTAAVTGSTNRWNFGTQSVTSPTVEYAAAETGPWLASPTATEAATMRYAKVSVSQNVGLFFMPVVNSQKTQAVTSFAVAGRKSDTTLPPNNNLLPFSPIAPNPTNTTTFGFTVGNRYTLRWASNVNSSGNGNGNGNGNGGGNSNGPPDPNSMCSGDYALGYAAGSPVANYRASGSYRGFWGETSGSDLSEWIDKGYPYAVSIGGTIDMVKGTKNGRKNAMDDRVESDTDKTSLTYAAYEANQNAAGKRIGNGRRIVAVPVHGGDTTGNGNSSPETVLGFAAFFLDNLNYSDTGGNEPYCAEFIGLYTPGVDTHGGGGGVSGVAKLRLTLP